MTQPDVVDRLVWFYWFTVAAVAVVVIFNLLVAIAFHYPYPRNDDWNLYKDYLELGAGGFLFHQYLGHALTLTKLIFLGNIVLLPGTSMPPLILIISLNMLTAFILASLLWRFRGQDTTTAASVAACALIVGMVFWMCRHLELTWTSMVGYAFVITCVTIAAWALFRHLRISAIETPRLFDRWLGLAAVAGVLGTFSFGAGAAIWPGIATVMILFRVPWPRIAIFLGIGVAAFVLHGMAPARISLEFSETLKLLPSPGQAINFFFTFLGTAINFSIFPFDGVRTGMPRLAAVTGVVGLLILTIYSWRLLRASRQPHPVLAVPLALAWFAIFTAVLPTLGRAGSEVFGNPNDYRYPGWSAMLWIGLVWIALHHSLQRRATARTEFTLVPAAGILLIVFAMASFHGVNHLLDAYYKHRLGGLSTIVAPAIRLSDLRYISPSHTEERLQLLPEMRARQHNPFDQPWTHHIGRSLSAHYRKASGVDCTGVWRIVDERSDERSRVYEGWATGPHGTFDTLLLVSGDSIIGGAKPTWLGDPRELDEMLPGWGRYFAGMLLGHRPGWTGVSNERFAETDEQVQIYGLLDEQTVCRVRGRP